MGLMKNMMMVKMINICYEEEDEYFYFFSSSILTIELFYNKNYYL